jgi:hypothetical protein
VLGSRKRHHERVNLCRPLERCEQVRADRPKANAVVVIVGWLAITRSNIRTHGGRELAERRVELWARGGVSSWSSEAVVSSLKPNVALSCAQGPAPPLLPPHVRVDLVIPTLQHGQVSNDADSKTPLPREGCPPTTGAHALATHCARTACVVGHHRGQFHDWPRVGLERGLLKRRQRARARDGWL